MFRDFTPGECQQSILHYATPHSFHIHSFGLLILPLNATNCAVRYWQRSYINCNESPITNLWHCAHNRCQPLSSGSSEGIARGVSGWLVTIRYKAQVVLCGAQQPNKTIIIHRISVLYCGLKVGKQNRFQGREVAYNVWKYITVEVLNGMTRQLRVSTNF
jgi:hypothetical protein